MFHAVIADKLRAEPGLLSVAEENLQRWSERYEPGAEPVWMGEWRQWLAGPFDELLAFLVAESEEAFRLRQSSPLAGVLSEEERAEVDQRFRAG